MNLKRNYALAIVLFFLGLVALVGVDYTIRLSVGVQNQLGLNESLWFALQLLVAILAMTLFLYLSRRIPVAKRLLHLTAVGLLGIAIYIPVIYGYVLMTRVDGF